MLQHSRGRVNDPLLTHSIALGGHLSFGWIGADGREVVQDCKTQLIRLTPREERTPLIAVSRCQEVFGSGRTNSLSRSSGGQAAPLDGRCHQPQVVDKTNMASSKWDRPFMATEEQSEHSEVLLTVSDDLVHIEPDGRAVRCKRSGPLPPRRVARYCRPWM